MLEAAAYAEAKVGQRVRSSDGLRWYVARTQPRKEFLARQHLERQGYKVFLPYLAKGEGRGAIARTISPLFPGYLFARLNVMTDTWRSVNGTRGVVSLVGNGRARPVAVPQLIIDQLLERCPGGLCQFSGHNHTVGDRVRIRTGPFADFTARIVAMDAKGRIELMLELLGGSIFRSEVSAVEPT